MPWWNDSANCCLEHSDHCVGFFSPLTSSNTQQFSWPSLLEKLSSIEDRGQTDHVIQLPCLHNFNPLASAAPRVSLCQHAADNVTTKSYYYGRHSILIKHRSRYSCCTHIFALTLTLTFNPQRAMVMTHTHAENQVKRSVDSKQSGNKQTDRQSYATDCLIPFLLVRSVNAHKRCQKSSAIPMIL